MDSAPVGPELRAYLADESSGLWIIDVSNPAALVALGSFDTPGQASGVAVPAAWPLLVAALASIGAFTLTRRKRDVIHTDDRSPALRGS